MQFILILLILAADGDLMVRPVIDHIDFDTEITCIKAAAQIKRAWAQDIQQGQLGVDPRVIVSAECVKK